MATYTKVCSNNSNYTLRLELSESNVNIVNNTSVINYSLYLDSSYTRFEDWDVTYTLYLGSVVSINNTSRMSMPPTRGEPLLLTSGSRTVTHYDDGSMSLSISCSVSTSTSQFYLPGSATISGQSFTMTTIARKSTLYNINQLIGYTFNLEVTRYSNSFTHTISYVFGGLSGVIVAKSSQLKIPWTPPLEAYLQIVGKQDGQGTITIETFSGNTSLGTNSYTLRLVAKEVYNPPAVEGLRYERGSGNSDSTWVSDPTGSNIKVSYKVAFTSGIDGNTTKLSVKLDSSVEVSETLTTNGVKVHYIQNIGTTTTHQLYINLFDTIGSNRVWTLTVSTIEVPFDINVNLPGLACGKVAETKKAFEFAEGWKLKFGSYPMMDFIIEQGNSGAWAYRKWSSGTAECWLESDLYLTGTTPVAYMNGSAYYSYATAYLPFAFQTRPRIVAEGNLGTGMGFVNVSSSSGTRNFTVYVTGNQESADITIHAITVTGRWK